MKKNIYNIFAVLATVIALFTVVSCVEETPVSKEPVFPELVTEYDVVPGTELHLSFKPNMTWTLSVSEESYKWFKIKDGRFEVASLSGVSSDESIDVTIVTTTEESFSIRACEVTLTMGDKSQVIAKYSLQAKERTIEMFAANKTEDGFEYADNSYVYSDQPLKETDVIDLVWDSNSRMYYAPAMVRANYEWEVEWPEWARADINASSKIGDLELQLYGIASELPMEEKSGVIKFKSGDQVLKSYGIRIPSSKDKFDFNLGGYTSLSFDHACYFHSGSGSYTKDPVQGFIYGPQQSRVVLFDYLDGQYVPTATSSWVNLSLEAWDSVEGADVLQEREISISVSRHFSAESRKALMLILPATVESEPADMLTSDKSQVKAEYLDYVVTLTQSGRPAEYITFEESESAIVEAGIIFERSSENLLPSKNFTFVEGCEDWQYNLSYVKDYASSKSAVYVTEPFATLEIYDADGNLITENLSEHWLSYSQLGDGLYGQIVMDKTLIAKDKEKAIDGYVVFKDDFGAVLCAVHCFYVAEVRTDVDVLEDVSSQYFRNPGAAFLAGATIHKVVSGPTYEKYKEHQAPIFIVKYTRNNTSLEINTSTVCQMYTCVGKNNGPEMVTIDDQMYRDEELYAKIDEYLELMEKYNAGLISTKPVYPDTSNERSTMGLLTFGKTSFETRVYPGYSKFNMTMPEKVTEKTMEEVLQFSTSEAIQFVFICVLEIK